MGYAVSNDIEDLTKQVDGSGWGCAVSSENHVKGTTPNRWEETGGGGSREGMQFPHVLGNLPFLPLMMLFFCKWYLMFRKC